MNNLKRFTVCKLAGHKWLKISYPPTCRRGGHRHLPALRAVRQGEPRGRDRMPAAGAARSSGLAISAPPAEVGDPATVEDGPMSPLVEPQHSVILVVGREQFTPPKTFGGEACTATHDCVAIGVRTVEDGPTDVTISPEGGTGVLVRLGEFQVETEGLLSVRSVYNKEYDAMGVPPGLAQRDDLGRHRQRTVRGAHSGRST